MTMDRDTITRTGARAPGVERKVRTVVHEPTAYPGLRTGMYVSQWSEGTKGRGKPNVRRRMPGAGLSDGPIGKALSEMPAFQPYWGKPAVRNDRGDGGNVGIIRSPLRATVLPDCGGAISNARPYRDHVNYFRVRSRSRTRELVLCGGVSDRLRQGLFVSQCSHGIDA